MTDHTRPTIGIIGGSGVGDALLETLDLHVVDEVEPDTPFGRPSAPLIEARLDDTRLFFLKRHGIGHRLNPAAIPYRANMCALRMLGCTHIVASGATGSLREHIAPGDIVICDQLIDKTDGRHRTFYDDAAVHVEFADPFCPVLRRWLLQAAGELSTATVHDAGTYLCMEGPSFSTRAEAQMHRAWGADLVGMTACPEARLAREAELAYALIGLPTDYDCWRERPQDSTSQSLLEEIIGNLNRATQASIELLAVALRDVAVLAAEPSPAHSALALGIWTRPEHIPAEAQARLHMLWGHRLPS